jgi:hypothetical protein
MADSRPLPIKEVSKPKSTFGMDKYTTESKPYKDDFNTIPTLSPVKIERDIDCRKYPRHEKCRGDEYDISEDLTLYNGNNAVGQFAPENYMGGGSHTIEDIYEKTDDDIQLDAPIIKNTTCKCKDGSVVAGKIDMRTGKKDCSGCKGSQKLPNHYNRPKPKKRNLKPTSLRSQAGVSSFGNVNLKGCNAQREESVQSQATKTLNNTISIDRSSPKGARVSQKENLGANAPISMYDDVSYNIYNI